MTELVSHKLFVSASGLIIGGVLSVAYIMFKVSSIGDIDKKLDMVRSDLDKKIDTILTVMALNRATGDQTGAIIEAIQRGAAKETAAAAKGKGGE